MEHIPKIIPQLLDWFRKKVWFRNREGEIESFFVEDYFKWDVPSGKIFGFFMIADVRVGSHVFRNRYYVPLMASYDPPQKGPFHSSEVEIIKAGEVYLTRAELVPEYYETLLGYLSHEGDMETHEGHHLNMRTYDTVGENHDLTENVDLREIVWDGVNSLVALVHWRGRNLCLKTPRTIALHSLEIKMNHAVNRRNHDVMIPIIGSAVYRKVNNDAPFLLVMPVLEGAKEATDFVSDAFLHVLTGANRDWPHDKIVGQSVVLVRKMAGTVADFHIALAESDSEFLRPEPSDHSDRQAWASGALDKFDRGVEFLHELDISSPLKLGLADLLLRIKPLFSNATKILEDDEGLKKGHIHADLHLGQLLSRDYGKKFYLIDQGDGEQMEYEERIRAKNSPLFDVATAAVAFSHIKYSVYYEARVPRDQRKDERGRTDLSYHAFLELTGYVRAPQDQITRINSLERIFWDAWMNAYLDRIEQRGMESILFHKGYDRARTITVIRSYMLLRSADDLEFMAREKHERMLVPINIIMWLLRNSIG